MEYVFAFKRACLPFNGASVVDVVGFVAPDEVGGLIFTAAEWNDLQCVCGNNSILVSVHFHIFNSQ